MTAKQHGGHLTICTKYNGTAEETSMVVIEVEIQTGYRPTKESLDALMKIQEDESIYSKVTQVDHINAENKFALYFHDMKKTQSCYNIKMTHVQAVKNLKPSLIEIYDYYNPSEKCSITYKAVPVSAGAGKPAGNVDAWETTPAYDSSVTAHPDTNPTTDLQEQDYENYYDEDVLHF